MTGSINVLVVTISDTFNIDYVTYILDFLSGLLRRLSVLGIGHNLMDLLLRLFNADQRLVFSTSSRRLLSDETWIMAVSFACDAMVHREICCTD
jgi:hypothetical protein